MKSITLFFILSITAFNSFGQWEQLNTPRNSFWTYKIFSKDSILLVSTGCGTYYSFNNGAKWTALDGYGFSSAAVFNNTIYLAQNGYSSMGLKEVISYNGALYEKTLPFNDPYTGDENYPSLLFANSSFICETNDEVGLSPSTSGGFYYSYNAEDWIINDNGLTLGYSPPNVWSGNIAWYYHTLQSLNGNNNYLYLGTDQGIYRTSMVNSNWSNVNNGIPPGGVSPILCSDSFLIAASGSSIYKSTDNGNSWSLKYTLITNHYVNDLQNINDTLYMATSVYPDTTGPILFASYNEGDTWTPLYTGNLKCIYGIVEHNNEYFLTTDSGIYKGLNTLTNVNNNINCSDISKIVDNDSSIAAISNDIFSNPSIITSLDSGITWQNITALYPNNYFDVAGINNSYAVMETPGEVDSVNYSLYLCDNNGKNKVLKSTSKQIPYTGSIISNGSELVAVGEWAYISSDSGATWASIIPTAACSNTNGELFTSSDIYLSGCDRGVIMKPTKGGKWTNITTGIDITIETSALGYFKKILFVVGTDNSSNNYYYRSFDDGASWQTCGKGLPETNSSITAFASDSQNVYACTAGLVYYSSDSGANWNNISGGLPLLNNLYGVTSCLLYKDGYLYFGTYNLGIWRTSTHTLALDAPPSPGIDTIFLSPGILLYPNPASSYVLINPAIDQTIQRIDVYNTTGQLMLTETNANGNYLNVSPLAQGFYIVHVVTPGKNYYAKLVKQ